MLRHCIKLVVEVQFYNVGLTLKLQIQIQNQSNIYNSRDCELSEQFQTQIQKLC
jgi:hypothetical protein